ncbi:leucine-rich melanocyte differentiation-associated protein-like [Cimex lectularius]|uniref:Leucine-rich melanocyte differentiation-associated protein n=1 Tax=Cimex lectularius TaxID=79782 RepID=A0A8I6RPF7_CIMLE|nr:leucine-rich melanocyte differentiation-associated protein-like [Cimex lectularius]
MSIINFKDGCLNYVSQGAEKIPITLQRMYGQKAFSLDISYNSLRSLTGLSEFLNLEVLVLDNNQLGDDIEFPPLPTLHTLSINNNQLTDLQSFLVKVKENLTTLRHLSLLGNPACPSPVSHNDKDDDDYQRYRHYTLYHMPNLSFLDSRLVNKDERSEGIIRGRYMNIAHPQPDQGMVSPQLKRKYTPLPKSTLTSKGTYGKWTKKYSGKNSEGNKFIKNNQL